mmetsp:Transcript_3326/g.7371  ORF Transcript_3326/g.7371 Transcript_3326/m.7371 type:complete len:81 (-) Transcript_3326:175-417(-)
MRNHGVDYFTSEAGVELDCHEDDIDHKHATGRGFQSFQTRDDKMEVRFHDQSANEIYQVVIRQRFEHKRGGGLEEPVEIA